MTDLEKLKKTFDEIGVKYEEEECGPFKTIESLNNVSKKGYVLFHFIDGKFHSLETFE